MPSTSPGRDAAFLGPRKTSCDGLWRARPSNAFNAGPVCAARYMVTRKIADGGMAELYLGVQRGAAGFERPIVIKRVRAAFCADPATREALVDEAHVAMSLNHSNIVQVLDLGFAAGRYFLVLELVDGWDLSVLLDRAAQVFHPMPPELAMHLSAEICRALAFAHGKTKDGLPLHIVHRDVNPHNVLVSEQLYDRDYVEKHGGRWPGW